MKVRANNATHLIEKTNRPRKQYSAQEKVRILREHLIQNTSVSDVCERHGVKPSVFYRWQKEFFENGAAASERRGNGRERKLQEFRGDAPVDVLSGFKGES